MVCEREDSRAADTVGEILPVPPLTQEGTQTPPCQKGAARSARGFRSAAGEKQTTSRAGDLQPRWDPEGDAEGKRQERLRVAGSEYEVTKWVPHGGAPAANDKTKKTGKSLYN